MPDHDHPRHHTRAYFDAVSDYWQAVYSDPHSFTGYALQKLHWTVVARVESEAVGTPSSAPEKTLRIIDIGCGAGVTALELASRGHIVSGVDLAPEMIARATHAARSANLSVDFTVADATALPFPTASADVIIALGLLANLPDDRHALNEIRRILKPGGLLLLTMPNLLALDVLLALPASLPLFANATRFRRPLRRAANLARRLTGRPPKDPDAIRFGYSVIPWLYADRLRLARFHAVDYAALAFGPLMPLGRPLPHTITRRLSQSITARTASAAWLNHLGSITLYQAYNPTDQHMLDTRPM